MKIFGLNVLSDGGLQKALSMVSAQRGGWYPMVREGFAGAWQRNIVVDQTAVTAHHADFACKTLIASDIAKLRVKYVEQDSQGLWTETTNPAYSPVLRRPNSYQNRIQFWESWILSKLSHGNAYILKERDNRNVVVGLYVLNPWRVKPLVNPDDGSVFYQLESDYLSGINTSITVPAREMVHDRMNCLFHPLIGTPPVYASGMASQQGLNIQKNSIRLFENNATPGGILTAPGEIKEATAQRIKDTWEQNFGGMNFGRLAVLGDGLKFEKMAFSAVEGQLIDQLKLTAEIVCSTYHVPPYKIGVGALPSYNNIQALNVEYYSQCLQSLIEAAELCLDEGLEMRVGSGTEFDLDNLLRMDTVSQVTAEKEAIGAGFKAPNEARRRFDLKPVPGGDSPYMQQQNYSLEALGKRDALPDPFETAKPAPAPATAPTSPPAKEIWGGADDDDIAAWGQIGAWALKDALAECGAEIRI